MSDPQEKPPNCESPLLTSRRQMLHASATGGLALGLGAPGFGDDTEKKTAGTDDDAKTKEILKRILRLLDYFDYLADKWLNGDDKDYPARKAITAFLYPSTPSKNEQSLVEEHVKSKLSTNLVNAVCTCHFDDGSTQVTDPGRCQYLGGTCGEKAPQPQSGRADPWEAVRKAIAALAEANELAYQWIVGKAQAQEVILALRFPSNWKIHSQHVPTLVKCRFDGHEYHGLTMQQCQFLGGKCVEH